MSAPKNSKLKYLSSYLFDTVIESFDSPKNGKINVVKLEGKLMVNTRNANQSFDGLHFLFQAIFADLQIEKNPPKKVLCFGLGGGSIVHILKNELKMFGHITAVEYDEVMVEIAKKYFDLQQFNNLEVITEDAFIYASEQADENKFDIIIVDLFEDNKAVEKIYEAAFNEQLLQMCPNGTLIINTICNNKIQENENQKLLGFYQNKGLECVVKTFPISNKNKILIVNT
jgi:spermidine synthase